MSNDNSIQAISGFDVGEGPIGGFIAANGSAMNGVNAVDGSFAGFCTFYVRGEVAALPVASPVGGAGFLWGTLSANRGWSLQLTAANNILSLTASMGITASSTTVSFPLTATDDGAGNPTSLVERLIMAGLWYDGDTMALSINGNLVATATIGAYAPGSTPARMGVAPGDSLPAVYADILSCGYFTGIPLSSTARLVGQMAGLSFRAAREAYGSGFILPDSGRDWTHRYWAKTLAEGNAPAANTISKNSVGVSITAPASANAVLADIGQSGSQDVAPTGLTQLNPGELALYLASQKNPDWYHGAGIVTVAPEG